MYSELVNKYLFKTVSIIASALMFVFITYKAYLMVFTGDEAASFYDIQYMNFAYLFGAIANSHLLNTLYIYPLVKLGVYSPFMLRLANVLAFLMYAYGCYRLLKDLNKPVLSTFGFLLLITNPFLIDYFSLCRGYGMALGFMLIAMVYLMKYLDRSQKTDLLKFTILGVLCVWSNYSYLYFYLIAYLLIGINFIRSKELLLFLKENKTVIAINVVFAVVTLPIIYNLKKNGALWWGGNTGFITDSIGSLIKSTQYFAGTLYSELLLYMFFFLVLISSVIYIIKFPSEKNTYPAYLFLGISILTILLFYTLGNLFLYERTAIILIPLMLLMWIFIVSKWRYFTILVVIISIVSIYHFVNSADPRYTFTYFPDSEVDEVVEDLKLLEANQNRQINIASGFHFVSGINFYKDANNYGWIQTVGFDLLNPLEGGFYNVYYNQYPNRPYDYFYFWETDEWYFRRLYNFKIIKRYPVTKTCLAVAE
jgi:hypothetical protein